MKVLVTGTTGGIGGAVKRAALARGWEVAELNRAEFAALETATIPPALDALVFATGTCAVKPLGMQSDAEFAEAFEVNCGLFVKLMRRVVRERLFAPSGMRAVAVSSVSAVEGWAGGTAYCASKGALSAVCRALDVELRPKRISVTAIEPRHVRTRMFERCAGRMGADPAQAQPPEELAEEILARLDPTQTN